MSKWVSVKDVMPGDLPNYCCYEWVLVWDENGRDFGIGRYIEDYGWELLGETALNIPRSVSSICREEISLITLKVTHWKQISVPRKKREKKEDDDCEAYPF